MNCDPNRNTNDLVDVDWRLIYEAHHATLKKNKRNSPNGTDHDGHALKIDSITSIRKILILEQTKKTETPERDNETVALIQLRVEIHTHIHTQKK